VGIRPSSADVLDVNPLVAASSVSYFRADRVMYHGHDVAVQWDKDGSRYGTKGLQVEVDGKIVASSPTLKRLSVALARKAPPAITRRIAKSVQLNSTTAFPRASVSVTTTDTKALYGSIDGRIWFFPETDVANGWSTPVGDGSELWFQIDFGTSVSTSAGELAFFADKTQGFDVPDKYRVQAANGATWTDVGGAMYGVPVANGITDLKWTEVKGSKVRLVFTPKKGSKVRLVEFKVY
jgi:hypothetical protein